MTSFGVRVAPCFLSFITIYTYLFKAVFLNEHILRCRYFDAVIAELTDESCTRPELQLQAASGPFFPLPLGLLTLNTGVKTIFLFQYFTNNPCFEHHVEYDLLTSVNVTGRRGGLFCIRGQTL